MPDLKTILSQPIDVPDLSDMEAAPMEIVTAAGGSVVTYSNGKFSVSISTVDDQRVALELLKDVRERVKNYQARFKRIKDPMNAAKDAVLAEEHLQVDPLISLDKALSKANSDFTLAQERAAYEERRKLERIEREKQQAEARAESERLEKAGKIGEAVNVMLEAESAPLPFVAAVAPVQVARVAGIQSRPSWSATVVDLLALAKYCVENPALASMFLAPNMVALNQQAKQLKENFDIPGVKAEKKFV